MLLLDFVCRGWGCSFDLLSASCQVTVFLAAQVARACSVLAVVFTLILASVGKRPPGKSNCLACLGISHLKAGISECPCMKWRCMPWSVRVARLRKVEYLAGITGVPRLRTMLCQLQHQQPSSEILCGTHTLRPPGILGVRGGLHGGHCLRGSSLPAAWYATGGLCPSQCLIWNPDGSGVRLWPSVVFLPKVLETTYVKQPIKLAHFNLPSGDEGSPLLCLVRTLRVCTDATASPSSAMVVQEVEVLCPSSGCPTGLWIPLDMPT